MTYAEVLSQLWRDHLAGRRQHAPTVCDTFSGGGGSGLGWSSAGFDEVCAVEWTSLAAGVLRENFPRTQVYETDIRDFDPRDTGLEPGELDVQGGSPPCQGFSNAKAHRDAEDPRNQLWKAFHRCAAYWRPRIMVLENVATMGAGSTGPIFREMMTALGDLGYDLDARKVRFDYLGVPQKRQRLIVIGVRSDLGIKPRFPRPSGPVVTVRQAWQDLPGAAYEHRPSPKVLRLAQITAPGERGADALKQRGGKEESYSLRRLGFDQPGYTIVSSDARMGKGQLHPRLNRFITEPEIKRLGSFPDEFSFESMSGLSDADRYRSVYHVVGNSVPPLAMRSIALTVRELLTEASRARP
jgi:DNA (cytosine-5)-methyltransferase 1